MIDDAKSMEEELLHNKMVKRDLKNILGYVTPYIPLIGVVCGISIVGKHVYNRKTEEPTVGSETTINWNIASTYPLHEIRLLFFLRLFS